MEVTRWIVGLLFASVVGGLAAFLFLYSLRGALGLGAKPKEKLKRVPPWLTGVVERIVFATLVGLNVAGAATAMMGWLAIKLATNWNRKDMENNPNARAFSSSALLAGLVSLLFAALGGMIASGNLWANLIAKI